jgi:SAM-dependent methyltransferase
MANFAELDESNYVLRVIVIADDKCPTEEAGIAFCKSLFGQDTNWLRTSYTGSYRRQYAGIGFQYIPNRDIFFEPMPRDGFAYILDTVNYAWIPTNKPPIYIGYAPTPVDSIEQIFDDLQLTSSEKFVDLGCGDGRIVIAAAKRGMQATGVEANPALYTQSQIDAQEAGVAATFVVDDLVNTDLTPYTVIYMYLGAPLCDAVLPKIQALPAGRTIISGDYAYPNWTPLKSYDLGGRKFYAWKT